MSVGEYTNVEEVLQQTPKETNTYQNVKFEDRETNWPISLFYIYMHIFSCFGLLLVFSEAKLLTTIFSLVLILFGTLGLTAGAHRLWAHHCYTANTQLKIFLMICHTLCGQGSIYNWVLNHRLHHKHFETDLDPYNPKRGFIYSHVVCNIKKPTARQLSEIKGVDMTDIESDSVVMFQKKFYWLLVAIVFLLFPINTPAEYWGEGWLASFAIVGCCRYVALLNIGWSINSATRVWGLQRGEKFPADTNMVFLLTKSYWLQYHYLVPWDYQTGEYGKYGTDCTTVFIRVFAALGMATDLRSVDSQTIKTAVSVSVDTGKNITECIHEISCNGNVVPNDHYLQPSKYC